MTKKLIDIILLPMVGITVMFCLWAIASAVTRNPLTNRATLPGPIQTWEQSKIYITEPFAYRGESDQGILRLTWLSLVRVMKGYLIALAIGTPIGFLLGSSELFRKCFDPIIQVLRPVSPLAWLPLGYLLFMGLRDQYGMDVGEAAAIFTVAICSLWPTVMNTAVGVRAIPQDYHNVAKVLNLSGPQKLFRILIPATLPYMFTGFRLSLGIAWLVIVAAEMLTGKSGLGGFLNMEYNAGIQEHIILCIITVGVVGFILDRIMSLIEQHITKLPHLISVIRGTFAGSRPQNRSVAHAVS